uniref:phage adaptor protein n=1 Tax=Paracoccus sp. TaxID=267 RepID=UPI0033415678
RHHKGEKRSNAEIEDRFTRLPSDYLEMTRLSVVGGRVLEYVTQDRIGQMGERPGDLRYFSVTGGEIEVAHVPPEPVRVEMAYYATLPKIRTEGANWLGEIAPDAYLYGALLQSAPYLQEDSRIEVWGALYRSAVDALNAEGRAARWPGKLVMR